MFDWLYSFSILDPTNTRYDVYVIHWNTGTAKTVTFQPHLPVTRFMFSCGISFNLPRISKRLYYLHPKANWEEKIKIETSAQLKYFLDNPEEEIEEYFYTIYLFTGDNSPDSSPKKLLIQENEEQQEHKVETASSNSRKSRGSFQTRFRTDLLTRDGDVCRTCLEKNSGEACHIIDVEWNFPNNILMREFSLMSVYDPRNGIILCKNCHWDYDHFFLGIDPDGNIYSRHSESTRTFSKTIYLDEKEKEAKNTLLPSKKVLKFKYQRFLDHMEDDEGTEASTKKAATKKNYLSNLLSGLSLTPQKISNCILINILCKC